MAEISKHIFKAYDIRGIYPDELHEETVWRITRALMGTIGGRGKRTIVVGHDARLSGPSLYSAVLRALTSGKSLPRIHRVGLITTPMLVFLVNRLKADVGIMITASHNPKEYNGIKAVLRGGAPVSGTDILALLQNSGD